MKQKDCYRKVTGKVVVVAVEATKEVSRSGLMWALTNVVQPGDCIKLLAVIPPFCSNIRSLGLSGLAFATDCITAQWRSRLGTVSDQKEVFVNSCSQMVLQLHQFYDPEKIKIRIKILSGSFCGAVAAEAKRAKSSWVILDRKLKNEKKYCMEELNCSVVIMERSGPNVLRLNLILSTNMEHNAFPRNFKGKSEHANTIKCPIVTPGSSLKQGSKTASIIGTPSTPWTWTSPFYQYGNDGGRRKDLPFSQNEVKNVEEGVSNSESEIIMSLSSCGSYFQPWISNAICGDEEFSKNININEALVHKLDHDPVLGVLNCKIDVNISRSVREAISLGRNGTTASLPLCSICQHKAPLFGNPPRWFTFAELKLATAGFSQENLLAENEVGSVHRGVLSDGQVVAIKQCKLAATQDDEEFSAQVQVLSCTQHRNVVMLIGFCLEYGRKILVYEYICNGSLYSHLHEKNENVLNWSARKKIALGVARGLRYLHEECRVGCIVHGDIRPCNIFLTHDFEPLVCLNFNMKMHRYLAPEYTESGDITEKADVYSFGVLLLELLTGRKALDRSHQCLHEWGLVERGDIDEVVDPNIRNCIIDEELHRMLQCSTLCIQHHPRLRPPMSQVLQILEGYVLQS
ncbi:inactive protein kinase SELMODRAFT_444075-like [Vigna umbellata]|uniref:inactive protein kinase SELMODRAFT_444075-like n=1 Tax=Vigna umbellata TaxID=87088 RepID=UPI001F5F1F35|nr:inactive protein kinase SELMODRAFT_444075-like [Vigna umbellata]